MENYPIIKKTEIQRPLIYSENGLFKVASNQLEKVLADNLSEKYGAKISLNQKVGYYFPDIVFIDNSNGICIDIEIDEPYSKAGSPTHYIDSRNDIQRDTYFIENGWNVIRFSENQVKNQIGKVILTFVLFYKSITEKTTENLDNHLIGFSEKRWSYNESLEYIRVSKREYYAYQTIRIEENNKTVIKEFQTFADIFDEILDSNIPNFDFAKEIIFLPYFISDHYIDNSDSSGLLFLNCLPSDGLLLMHGKEYTICHFSNYPKIEIFNSSNLESFNYITKKKRDNHRIHIIDDYHNKYFYYDFFFKGTMQDFFESTLCFFPGLSKIGKIT